MSNDRLTIAQLVSCVNIQSIALCGSSDLTDVELGVRNQLCERTDPWEWIEAISQLLEQQIRT